ncbi:RNA 3'-terminal phosphate cyclase [Aporhodopirellula aestuarii]|uniref:RNA 3'-terminal phosphate cyclase n=1 Tax=Aporhodopirellula aestuarii TaxID=2950107 RepID=A0ABT0U8G2_9BACT|nr:RNA 3'-terminal phosphate cyclase [Aporhodopirellula aestuarii]MCM2373200.1 RNA 3'-terminal phosphate cyclase [Aporhodopirellula aestuarii]
MIEIDGSEGEGGGQIVRSSLALAAVAGVPVRLINIRGGRKKPGLLRQHLAGVNAIARISNAGVEGANLGSQVLTITPGKLCGGGYAFEVGSAGSAILVAQTILPALLHADRESTVTIGGGTHAAWAPPFDFFAKCYLPLLAKMNGNVNVSIESHGFYPAGGGRIVMQVQPTSALRGLSLMDRQGELDPLVQALVARIPESVGKRECEVIRRKTAWNDDAFEVHPITKSGGPGNVVMIECGFDNVTELVIGFGKLGVKAEHVARSVLREARVYLASGVPVGPYLADQLLLPMGLAANSGHASEFRTTSLSKHSLTHIEVLRRFLEIDVAVSEGDDGSVTLRVGSLS